MEYKIQEYDDDRDEWTTFHYSKKKCRILKQVITPIEGVKTRYNDIIYYTVFSPDMDFEPFTISITNPVMDGIRIHDFIAKKYSEQIQNRPFKYVFLFTRRITIYYDKENIILQKNQSVSYLIQEKNKNHNQWYDTQLTYTQEEFSKAVDMVNLLERKNTDYNARIVSVITTILEEN